MHFEEAILADPQLRAVYEQLDGLLRNLTNRTPLDTEIGQAAYDLNLALRVVQRALPQFEVVKGMRELIESDNVVELISRASALHGVLLQHLFYKH